MQFAHQRPQPYIEVAPVLHPSLSWDLARSPAHHPRKVVKPPVPGPAMIATFWLMRRITAPSPTGLHETQTTSPWSRWSGSPATLSLEHVEVLLFEVGNGRMHLPSPTSVSPFPTMHHLLHSAPQGSSYILGLRHEVHELCRKHLKLVVGWLVQVSLLFYFHQIATNPRWCESLPTRHPSLCEYKLTCWRCRY